MTFRGNTDEVLDIFCAQLRFEELQPSEPRLMPSLEVLKKEDFPRFAHWWYQIRSNCGPSANVSKHRAIGLLIPALQKTFESKSPSNDQWTLIGRFLKGTRDTARTILNVEFPEPKGKWTSQRAQLDAFDNVAQAISRK
jgi:hypothetical protein